jgi:hypothetical protein
VSALYNRAFLSELSVLPVAVNFLLEMYDDSCHFWEMRNLNV